jgi:hypothetical protein
MPDAPQTYANHRAIPKPVVIVLAVVLLGNALAAGWLAVSGPSLGTICQAVIGIVLFLMLVVARSHAQTIQDRVIRLEMQLRLHRVLPADRHGDIAKLELRQLIALRFASDAELPALVAAVISGALTEPDAIKQKITAWQADWLRV